MPKTTKVVTQLPVRLDKELQAFEDEAYPLLPSQRKRFEQLASLIGQTVTRTATNSSRASQWRLTRASRMLHAIGSNLGAEVLYLCTQVSTVNSLCSMDESDVISILSTWWSNKPCPASLTRAAEQLWKSCALDDHIQTQSPRVRADIAVHNPPEAAQVDAESQSLDNHIRTQSPRTRGEIAEPNLPEAAQVDTEGAEMSSEITSDQHALDSVARSSSFLAGDVFELTSADLQYLATSDQIRGQILLTDPYEQNCSPFITIPISEELRSYFTLQRVQIYLG